MLDFIVNAPGLPAFNPMMLLHGEQKLEQFRPFKPDTKVITLPEIIDVSDKGKGCLLTIRLSTYQEDATKQENLTYVNTINLFIRQMGGFGYKGQNHIEILDIPSRLPDKEVFEKTAKNQAIIYRLSGDYNPLHIDPAMAEFGGFEKPILHGLCTYGIITRAAYDNFCDENPTHIRTVQSRFTSHVFPGETLHIKFWRQGTNLLIFSASTKERGKEVIVGNIQLNFNEAKAKL
eukprot:TRINITY_DN5987_c0_g1_i1.p1 TRINITY_DN5987_c0_g1~~TRINITY_DN5987_c0_g1_i1.p1  ORF type:complete len:233 (-),score=24.88 TRINITY_DN5987_c0_g1_i1:116-814(-)